MPNYKTIIGKWLGTGLLTLVLGLVSTCATAASSPDGNDPFENMNRSILEFNLDVDRALLRPVAKSWRNIMPTPVRRGVGNFFSNLWQPMTVVNDLLQGKVGQATRDTFRFLVNTTAGLLGIFDVASALDLPRHKEDFGQTLAVWGVPPGPYLVLPFLGPGNLRDTVGLVPQSASDAVGYLDSPERFYASGLRLLDMRSRLLDVDGLLEVQPDPYIFLRETWRQSRENLIHDGNPPRPEGELNEDALIDELLQDDS